jgi:hypothetical protein
LSAGLPLPYFGYYAFGSDISKKILRIINYLFLILIRQRLRNIQKWILNLHPKLIKNKNY